MPRPYVDATAQVRTKVWVEARDALQTVDDEIAIVRTEQLRLETLQSKLERVRRLAPHLQALTTRQAELDALGDVVELAASAYDELVQARADIAAAKKVAEERASDFDVQEIARSDSWAARDLPQRRCLVRYLSSLCHRTSPRDVRRDHHAGAGVEIEARQ